MAKESKLVRLKIKIEGDNYIYKDVAEHSLEAEYAALVLKAASMTSVGEVPDLLPIIA
jgi:hypothetical protein